MTIHRNTAAPASRRVPIAQVHIGDDEIDAVARVLRSGNLRAGAECRAFEEEFAQQVGAAHALAVNSGTAALHMAYAAVLRPGDEVLVPDFTFVATASMVLAAGATPVFCDIDPRTLTIDLNDAASRINSRTRAIAPVHLFGNPVDLRSVQQLAGAHDLAVIWDAAQAHGTLYDGADVGSFPGVVCYSFYPTKNMTTGEGGMVCTDDAAVADRLALLRSHGESVRYRHVALGYNFRMTDVQAAMGRIQLRKLPEWILKRRANAAVIQSRLEGVAGIRFQREQSGGVHSYHQLSLMVEDGLERDAFVDRLRSRGVECAVHYPIPLHDQPLFEGLEPPGPLPVAQWTAQHIVSLPVHPFLSDDDLGYVATEVRQALV